MIILSKEILDRYEKYSHEPGFYFRYHSEYFGHQIDRAYNYDQARALYRIQTKRIDILADSLDRVKQKFRDYQKESE